MKQCEQRVYNAEEAQEIGKQAEVELALLANIEQSFRIALQWPTQDRASSRKLSTLRFVAQSFERHLTRMRVLADYGGYMHLIIDAKPHLAGEVQALKSEREDLQANLERMMIRLDQCSFDDAAGFGKICAELESYLGDLKAHGQREMELLHHSFVQEEGGSG